MQAEGRTVDGAIPTPSTGGFTQAALGFAVRASERTKGAVQPYLEDPDFRLYHGDVRDVLAELEPESVDCCVTSPPFYGLRDYGVDGQIGLEATPDEWVANLVGVFREVRRVLKPQGVMWVEVGDSYNAATSTSRVASTLEGSYGYWADPHIKHRINARDLKPKDLLGQPWMLAFALRADGWVLRQHIVWFKPNCMPESVHDRCTTAHSHIFLFAKAKRSGPQPSRWEGLPEADKRVLATLIDTEGCISFKRARNGEWADSYGAQIAVTNQSIELLASARSLVADVGNVSMKDGTNAPVHYWQIHNKNARDLLLAIYPYLIVKRRQARLAIYGESLTRERGPMQEFGKGRGRRTETTDALLERCWTAIKECNQRGEPDLSWCPEPKYGKWTSQPYWFDADAIAEPAEWARWGDQTVPKYEGTETASGWIRPKTNAELDDRYVNPGNRSNNGTYDGKVKERRGFEQRLERADGRKNARSVWSIPTAGFSEAHFATFPEALVERMLKAGCPEGGVVLDPFMGSGTTALVARRLGRRAIGVELNESYCRMAVRRLQQLSLLAEMTS